MGLGRIPECERTDRVGTVSKIERGQEAEGGEGGERKQEEGALNREIGV